MFRQVFVLVLSILLLPFSMYADGGKLETIGPFPGLNASDSLKQSLEEKGYRVSLPDGGLLCEIWLRKSIPVAGKRDVSGAMYTEIADSALIGVITFPKTSQDFRGQDIKAGAYTLRYAMHPTDGNHMGISPFRDFLLLTPVTDDQNVEAKYKFEDLTKMSAKTTNSTHPAALSLVLAEGKDFPRLTVNEHEHLVFSAMGKTSSGANLPISFIVKGVAEK